MAGTSVALILFLQAAPVATPTAPTEQVPADVCAVDVSKLDPARDLTPPELTKVVQPVYPDAAVKAGKSGQVVIEMLVTKAGKTTDVKVKKGLDPDLDQAALVAVKQWEYKPALALGTPCPAILSVTVDFKLPGAPPAPSPSGEASPK